MTDRLRVHNRRLVFGDMTALKWWLRIVGSLYLLEGLGISAMAFFAPDAYGALWASTIEGTLDAIAVRGILIAGLPGTLSWVLFGALMWLFSGTPPKAVCSCSWSPRGSCSCGRLSTSSVYSTGSRSAEPRA